MKFQLNDQIAHPSDGACVVCDIFEKEVFDKQITYYSLAPSSDENLTLLVPVDSAEKIGLRSIVSEQEADEIIEWLENSCCAEWVSDHNLRFKHYKELFQNSSVEGLIALLSEMEVLLRKDAEKKLPNADKEVLRKIQKKAVSEIAMAKNSSFEEMLVDVQNAIQCKIA